MRDVFSYENIYKRLRQEGQRYKNINKLIFFPLIDNIDLYTTEQK